MAINQSTTIPTIHEAYSKYGSYGLTENGKKERVLCISGIIIGSILLAIMIASGVTLALALKASLSHPHVGAVIGGSLGLGVSLFFGPSSLYASIMCLFVERRAWCVEMNPLPDLQVNPPAKEPCPDPRGDDL